MAILTNLLHRWTLPPARSFGWKLKSPDSANTVFTIDKDGVFVLTIEHEILRGITPKMLVWWFQNIGGDMIYEGNVYPRYLVWHPEDHIHWSLKKQNDNGPIGVGSYFRIVEAFGRNMNYLVDSTECVEKLDESGIKLTKKIFGIEVFSLQHDFTAEGLNTGYFSTMKVGTHGMAGWIFNRCIRPLIFTKAMAKAWLRHNVEEVGNFEYFLPELYKEENHNSCAKK